MWRKVDIHRRIGMYVVTVVTKPAVTIFYIFIFVNIVIVNKVTCSLHVNHK